MIDQRVAKTDLVLEFGETLSFYFVREDQFCYPQVHLEGAEGTSAMLHGQHMSPLEIEKLGLALIKYAASLKNS